MPENNINENSNKNSYVEKCEKVSNATNLYFSGKIDAQQYEIIVASNTPNSLFIDKK